MAYFHGGPKQLHHDVRGQIVYKPSLVYWWLLAVSGLIITCIACVPVSGGICVLVPMGEVHSQHVHLNLSMDDDDQPLELGVPYI
jgi:hypothetical protein